MAGFFDVSRLWLWRNSSQCGERWSELKVSTAKSSNLPFKFHGKIL